jgi:signal transduction histidine kinase
MLFLLASVLPGTSAAWAQQTASPRRVLVLHWYDKDFPANARFNEVFQSSLQSLDPGIEYYSEYWETNRFPGQRQALLLRDYLQQKYNGRKIDALVAPASIPLDFLLKYRSELFPDASIVFATERPVDPKQMAASDATGVVYANSYRRTIDLALKLHPGTEQVFIISGSPANGGRSYESIARDELKGFEASVAIHYLTDVPPEELVERARNLPQRSIAFYIWQQARNSHGKLLESPEILTPVASAANAPIYGMSGGNIGRGIVGGYVWTFETMLGRLAQITLRVAHGARASDIPVERAPELPIFDWRQLQRWNIDENRLPRGSFVEFRQPTLWQQYKWRIIAALAVFLVQALLIGSLLMERRSARRSRKELEQYKDHLESVVDNRTAELVEARDHALAANRSKSTFLAQMSHELRTPLNAILGFSDLLLRDGSLSDRHRNDLMVIGRSGQHLLGLINDVLDMAKIESGVSQAENAAFDLPALVRDTVNMLRELALRKNLELVVDLDSRLPRFARSDPGKLRQVLINLVGNAIKYTDEGSIAVRADARPQDRSSYLLIFDVQDTGPGIAAEDQARIFDPFVQSGSPMTRKGTGLGLTITRHFVQLLGGTIRSKALQAVGRGFTSKCLRRRRKPPN